MPVENNLLPGNLPASTIGLNPKRALRPEDEIVKVRDKEGNIHEMTRSNMRDKVRLDGWTYVKGDQSPPKPEPAALKAEDSDDDIGEEAIGGHREPTELDHLRAEYAAKAGKQPDMRWGKKALQEKIELLD